MFGYSRFWYKEAWRRGPILSLKSGVLNFNACLGKVYKIDELRYVIPLPEPYSNSTRMRCKATRMEANRSRHTYIKEERRNEEISDQEGRGLGGGGKHINKHCILYFCCLRTCQFLQLHLFLYLLRLRIFGHFRREGKNWTCPSFRRPVHVLFKETGEATQMALHICDGRDAHPRTLHVPQFETARHLEVAALITWQRRI